MAEISLGLAVVDLIPMLMNLLIALGFPTIHARSTKQQTANAQPIMCVAPVRHRLAIQANVRLLNHILYGKQKSTGKSMAKKQ